MEGFGRSGHSPLGGEWLKLVVICRFLRFSEGYTRDERGQSSAPNDVDLGTAPATSSFLDLECRHRLGLVLGVAIASLLKRKIEVDEYVALSCPGEVADQP